MIYPVCEKGGMPCFGEKLEHQSYRPRPGSYAIMSHNDRIGVIKTTGGYHFPGGGAKPYETSEETLYREVLEETGYRVEIVKELGIAIDYIQTRRKEYMKKICTYYHCLLRDETAIASETDHLLEWFPLHHAFKVFNFDQSQHWALHVYAEYQQEQPV